MLQDIAQAVDEQSHRHTRQAKKQLAQSSLGLPEAPAASLLRDTQQLGRASRCGTPAVKRLLYLDFLKIWLHDSGIADAKAISELLRPGICGTHMLSAGVEIASLLVDLLLRQKPPRIKKARRSWKTL